MTIDLDARARLLEAATERFRRFGLRGTSVEQITTAAGVGKGSLYLHYASKQDLYLDVVRHEIEAFLTAATRNMSNAGRAPAKLRSLVDIAIAHYEHNELLSAPLLDDRILLDPDAAALARRLQRQRVTHLIVATLTEGQRDGTVRTDLSAPTTAPVLFEAGWAIVRGHLTGELELPLSDALDALNDVVGNGTLPRDQPANRTPRRRVNRS